MVIDFIAGTANMGLTVLDAVAGIRAQQKLSWRGARALG